VITPSRALIHHRQSRLDIVGTSHPGCMRPIVDDALAKWVVPVKSTCLPGLPGQACVLGYDDLARDGLTHLLGSHIIGEWCG
jgi:hypothetical protein